MWNQILSHSSSSLAWLEKGRSKSYGEFVRDVDVAIQARGSSCIILEAEDRYEALVSLFAAWRSAAPVCLIPQQWPRMWKSKVQRLIGSLSSLGLSDVFYIMPTSGSTGEPKLVPISHANWNSFMEGMQREYAWRESTRVALTFHPTFDPFVAISSMALVSGSTLIPLLPADHFRAFDFCMENKIEVWASTPTLARLSLQRNAERSCESLKESLFTGEVLSRELALRWSQLAPQSEIDNLYGPVETTVWLTRYRLNRKMQTDPIPIGRPLWGVDLRVIDGEIIVNGPQVSCGYLTESGLLPFSGEYRTGDQGETLDEVFYFKGRKDQQFKVGGRRIEGSLIENLLENETGVGVVADLNAEGLLCLVLERPLEPHEIQRIIRANLPPWYAPHAVFIAREWPLLPNGKVNRGLIHEWIKTNATLEVAPLVSEAIR